MGVSRNQLKWEVGCRDQWRSAVFLEERDSNCDVPDDPEVTYGSDMHEEWLSRADVMGMKREAREAIMAPWNCVLLSNHDNLHITTHIHHCAKRHLLRIYGKEHIQSQIDHFYDTFGHKSPKSRVNVGDIDDYPL